MTLPVLDVATVSPARLAVAFVEHGAILAVDGAVPTTTCDTMLRDVRAFFALPDAAKAALAIEESPCFRGYSRMHGERDFREQMHFGRERVSLAAGDDAAFRRLAGPNSWPDDAAWRDRVLDYVAAVEQVGARLLRKLATAFGLSGDWLGPDPYVLAKCIGYHPQPTPNARLRGVAAHLDFSLVTLTLQDDVGGLETRDPAGTWRAVPTIRGGWLVNIGEVLQFVTGHRLVATPHRVVNPSTSRSRCSVPVFVNPSLDSELRCELPRVPFVPACGEHVHAVLDPTTSSAPLHFGRAEWERKGRGVWCVQCVAAG